MKIRPDKMLLLVLLFSFLSVLGIHSLLELGAENQRASQKIQSAEYRSHFFSEEMRKQEQELSWECRNFLKRVEEDIQYFPIPDSNLNAELTVSFVNSWMAERSYKGEGVHEGNDIMAGINEPGIYPVVSISDGVITNLGWLEKGGYRIGITSPNGVYFYYAHLDSYADIAEGEKIKAGQLLGFMGDSGYGKEGTRGKFDVHLHLGVYSWDTGEEISVNPYYMLRFLEDKKLKYDYS